jgi:serine/threonine protein kinase
VLGIIGSGPIGIVLEVEDIATKVHYAAKLIHPRFTRMDLEASERLMVDMKRVALIDSPYLAKIITVDRDSGTAITCIRELMRGECLAARIEQVGQFSLRASISIIREILLALSAIHAENILNLDLSPADVFLSTTKKGIIVKLVDIGERHVKQLASECLPDLDSKKYYAPELFDKSRQPNHRADIYSVGAIFYHMLTGQAPTGQPTPIETRRKDVPTALAQMVMKALSPTSSNRFHNAEEFIHTLDAVDWDHPPQTADQINQPKSFEEEPASIIVEMPEIRFSRLKAVLWIAAVVLLVSGAAWFTFNSDYGIGTKSPEHVEITIDTTPKTASITVDGKRIRGNPAVVRVPMDTKLHTISAKSEGFEPIERDIKFNNSKTIKLELMEIVQQDDPNEPAVVATPATSGITQSSTRSVLEKDSTKGDSSIDPQAGDSSPAAMSTSYEAPASMATTGSKTNVESQSSPPRSTRSKQKIQPSSKKTPGKAVVEKKKKKFKGFRTKNPFE